MSHRQSQVRRHSRDHRRLWGLGFLAMVCALVALLAGPAAAVEAKDWRIDNIDVVLDVQENGDVLVDETVTFTFEGNYHFVALDIPLANIPNGISDIEVRDANGVALPKGDENTPGTYMVYEQSDMKALEVHFDLTDATETWTFHYRAKQMIMFFDVGDELRWYVFDAVTPVPIGAVKATVKLPGEVPTERMTQAVQAGYGVETNVTSPAASTMVYQASDIPAYTNFWIVTGFPKDVVKFTWTARRVAEFLIPKLGFLLPIITLLSMLLIWRKRGRDEPGQVYASYVSEPPTALAPGLAGALIDEKVDTKEVIATIVDLARRGYIEITDTAKQGKAGKAMTIFTRRKPLDDLQGFEAAVAKALFDAKHPDQVTTNDLKNHFYVHVEPITNQVYDEVTKTGLFFKNPKKARSRWIGYGIALAAILAVLTFILFSVELSGWGWFMLGSIVSVIIVLVFAPHMPQRTPKGAQEQRRWLAFRNYLQDLTRFDDMTSAKENFEKYLPYAIAFGVEKDWVRRFESLTVSSPDWYHPPVVIPTSPGTGPINTGGLGGGLGGGIGGPISTAGSPGGGGGFSLDSISDGLFNSLGNMSNVLTAVPSSGGSKKGAWGGGGFSGGGGGFGGGFSGGGGGGGFRAG
ncbi:MAG: DUF2207 domain-containing protein [Thermoleophilia bacterium]|nr:DUF2207 domain-containing protein [Thermoleophilia bacterium]